MSYDIVFIHLLNDSSGSPKVLRQTIEAVRFQNIRPKLFLGRDGTGILSHCDIPIEHYWYKRMGYRFLTLFTYFFSQVALFFKLLGDRSIEKNAIIYVNTLLPFGAALYGWMTGRTVIYHVHEISITPAPLKHLLITIARGTSCLNLYVSDTHKEGLPISDTLARRVYNSLDSTFFSIAKQSIYSQFYDGSFNILMIASLRDYKGVPELVSLAKNLQDWKGIRFDLVVNDCKEEIDRYFFGYDIPPNLIVHPRTSDPGLYYGKASLVLNLSRVDQWVETFGLTILEAMAYGIPVIVPPVGGPTELVVDGIHGYKVDSYNSISLQEKVLLLYSDSKLCQRMSAACRARASDFTPENYTANIMSAIEYVRGLGK